MPDTVTAIGQVLGRDLSRMTMHAGNLANANTIGFRAQVAGAAHMAATASPAGVNGSPDTVTRAPQPGRLKATGQPLDVAIIGDGWLVARNAAGELTLARNGHLHVDTEGYLASFDGQRMQGDGGDIFIGNTGRAFIDAEGQVTVNGEAVGHLLRVATPPDATTLPDGRLRVQLLPESSQARLATGVLEYANVDVAQEMTQLMTTSRHLESTQRALQLYDGLLATGINQIGKE